MTTRTHDAPTDATETEAPAGDGGATVMALAASIPRHMPRDLDGAREAVSTVTSAVAAAPDDDVLVGASLAAGIAIGLLVGGGPRPLAAGAVMASVALGAALLGRRPRRFRSSLATPAA